ncbi:uncharacterized protein PHALS_14527 [Plasmopara halstedii]|uniref:RxLR-like protein n=1 Tax=Plasmopara halstedii TaxID=4781 RepID=A0A0P1AK18_PLAHL|nr:uncharacterized protein PHALS_14527 [Plasmopara halstedii]CEG41354.1 hypothetical protein PHALS_14527 [Plasmopara halstedii]|eukprot:XP_024577723.1 hypothetical protein PHALS_14527 [Plasmopara halstedii]
MLISSVTCIFLLYAVKSARSSFSCKGSNAPVMATTLPHNQLDTRIVGVTYQHLKNTIVQSAL